MNHREESVIEALSGLSDEERQFLYERTLEIPDDTPDHVVDVISRLADVGTELTAPQAAWLRNTMDDVLDTPNETRSDIIQKWLSLLPSQFSKKLYKPAWNTFRKIDTDVLSAFFSSLQKKPMLPPKTLMASRDTTAHWPEIVTKRMHKKTEDESMLVELLTALADVYFLKVGGTAGMGDGELLYAILGGGDKGKRGDLQFPEIGEVELKGANGRLKGVNNTPGNSSKALQAIMRVLEDYPDIKQVAEQTKFTFTFNQKNIRNVYPAINNAVDRSTLSSFYEDFMMGAFTSLHADAYAAGHVDESIIQDIAADFTEGNFETGALRAAGLQFEIYRNSDGFDYLLAINPTSCRLITSADDIIEHGSIFKGRAPLQIKSGILDKAQNIGNVAGITLVETFS